MEFLIGALCGAILVWGLPKLFEKKSSYKANHYYYICPIEGCRFSAESNTHHSISNLAVYHESGHRRNRGTA